MLKIRKDVDINKLTECGFVSFRVSRSHTNYYFASRQGVMLLCNNVVREIWRDKIYEDDTRIHSVPKYQKRGVEPEDGLYTAIKAGLVISKEEEDANESEEL